MLDTYLIPFFVGFVALVGFASFLTVGFQVVLFFFILALAFGLLSRRRRLLVPALFCLGAACGLWRFVATDVSHVLPPELLSGKSSVEGVIIDEPSPRADADVVLVELDRYPAVVRVSIPRYPKFLYGDRVRLEGKIEEPKNFDDSFDWVGYLSRHGVSYTSLRPNITLIEREAGNPIKEKLFAVKAQFLAALRAAIPEPEASFGGGVTLGTNEGLPQSLIEEFRATGTSHLIAVSGYNVTIVAWFVLWCLGFLSVSEAAAFMFAVMGVVAFTLITGAEAATVRASLMTLLYLLARRVGRPSSIKRALVIAALVMIVYEPRILVFDLSFQLSFAAMLGMLYLTPAFEEMLLSWISWRPLRIGLAGTLGAELFVLPLILHLSGQVSIVSVFVNLLVIPLVPVAMGLVFVTGGVGLAVPPLSIPVGFLAQIVLSSMLFVIRFGAQLPLAYFMLPKVSYFGVLMLYGLLFVFIQWHNSRNAPVIVKTSGTSFELVE